MKTYIHKGRVIREDELKEITLPKVGDRFRVKKDGFWGLHFKKGEVIEVSDIHLNGFDIKGYPLYRIPFDGYLEGLEPVPSPPVCPPELLPLPDGVVYLGLGGALKSPKYRFYKTWEGNNGGGFGGICKHLHYATQAGDACHRSQPWFDESQVPKKLTLEVGKRYIMRNGDITKPLVVNGDVIYVFAEVSGSSRAWTKDGNYWISGIEDKEDIIREATPEECGELSKPFEVEDNGDTMSVSSGIVEPIDHTEGGKYRMLEEGEIIQDGDEYVNPYTRMWVRVRSFVGDRYVKKQWDSPLRRPINPLQEKLTQLKILVAEIENLTKVES